MVSVSTLRKTAGYGAVLTAGSCAYIYYQLQSRFASGDYYRLAVEALRSDEKLCKALGPPVRPLFLNLGNKQNVVDLDKAQLDIPIRGAKYKGILHTRCSKNEGGRWIIDSLVLEVNERNFPVNYTNQTDTEELRD